MYLTDLLRIFIQICYFLLSKYVFITICECFIDHLLGTIKVWCVRCVRTCFKTVFQGVRLCAVFSTSFDSVNNFRHAKNNFISGANEKLCLKGVENIASQFFKPEKRKFLINFFFGVV